jgi:hypothetical protein
MSMSDELDWNFVDKDDAKAEIRAAVEYLLRGATGGARGDLVQEIITIVRQVASGLPPEQEIPWTMICRAADPGVPFPVVGQFGCGRNVHWKTPGPRLIFGGWIKSCPQS